MRALALLALASVAAAGDAREEAWFAFRAGEQGDKEAIPRLLDALAKEPEARRWVLDALIRLEADVPAERVAGLFKELPDETLILLARDPNGNDEHLAAIAEPPRQRRLYLHWVAACNLLVARKSKRIAAPLLSNLELTVDIYVMDPHTERGLGGRSVVRFRHTLQMGLDPQWPPMPSYVLTEEQGGGAVPLAPGRNTVFFVRSALQPDAQGLCTVPSRVSRISPQEERLHYLAELLGVESSKLGFTATESATVHWRDAKEYPAAVAAARERVEAAYRAAVAKLVEAKLLDPQEAPKAPLMKVTVTDRRTDKSVALPPLEGVEMKPE